jgi:hypothetical protein
MGYAGRGDGIEVAALQPEVEPEIRGVAVSEYAEPVATLGDLIEELWDTHKRAVSCMFAEDIRVPAEMSTLIGATGGLIYVLRKDMAEADLLDHPLGCSLESRFRRGDLPRKIVDRLGAGRGLAPGGAPVAEALADCDPGDEDDHE